MKLASVLSLSLLAWLVPGSASASSIQLVSHTASYTFDVSAGATSTVDRQRILDSTTALSDFLVDHVYDAAGASSAGSAIASGALSLAETFTPTAGGIILGASRSSSGSAQTLSGTGIGFASLANNFEIVFDVVGTVHYDLTAFLAEDPNLEYHGFIRFDNTDPAIPPILHATSSIGTTVLTGTLTTGTYKLSGAMSGMVSATGSNPGPVSGTGGYGMTLALTVPEPGTMLLMALGLVGLLVQGGRFRHG